MIASSHAAHADANRDLTDEELRAWETVLLYHAGMFGTVASILPDAAFLAEDGRRDARQEFRAFLAALASPPQAPAVHPACRFPRRFAWVKMRRPELKLVAPRCDGVQNGLDIIPDAGVSLVFASQFLGNPASFFGHNFLLFKRPAKSRSAGAPLLDVAVSFSAYANTSNIFSYAWKGLTGGFSGHFDILPYFAKVQEYNNYERRDIWEYELSLPPSELEMLRLAIVEAMPFDATYFYLNSNCTTMLALLIESAKEARLFPIHGGFWTSPIAFVHALHHDARLVRAARYRPSIASALAARHADLSEESKAAFDRIMEAKAIFPGDVPDDAKARAALLDAVLDGVDYREHIAGSKVPVEYADLYKRALSERAKIAEISNANVVPPNAGAVHLGHRESMLELGIGKRDDGLASSIYYRPVLHDFGERDLGYSPSTAISVLGLEVLALQGGGTHLSRVELLTLKSHEPAAVLRSSWAWEGGIVTSDRLARSLGLDDGVLATVAHAGFGANVRPLGELLDLALIKEFDFGALHHDGTESFGGSGVSISSRLRTSDDWRVVSRARAMRYAISPRTYQTLTEASVALTYHVTRDGHAGIRAQRFGAAHDLSFVYGVFF